MELNDADRRRDIRESEDNGAETLFMPESVWAAAGEQDVVFTVCSFHMLSV